MFPKKQDGGKDNCTWQSGAADEEDRRCNVS